METAIVALYASMGLSFIGMVVAIVFDKPRLIGFFYLACMALGGGGLCVKYYRNVIKLIKLWKI